MSDHPLSGSLDRWEAVVEDMEATAAEYRERGWETLELHPGDVTALPAMAEHDDPFGLDVLVPGDEYAAVSALVGGDEDGNEDSDGDGDGTAAFDEFEAYRAQEGGLVFVLLVMKATAREQAVLIPLYYAVESAHLMMREAREAGEMRVFVRPLSDDERVTFTQADPEPLLPA